MCYQLPATSYQLPATSYQRLCGNCKSPIPDLARLNKKFCQGRCRAFVWSRANRQFSSAITVADFENVREHIKKFEELVKKRVIGYALIKAHPVQKKIGESTFPPIGRKTKRLPDETGKVRFLSTPFYRFAPWFEGPRVPAVGLYRLKVWYEGVVEPFFTAQMVEVRKAFPAVHFYDERTGLRYTLKGEVVPKKPSQPPTERKAKSPIDRAPAPQPERAPERVPSTDRVLEWVPAVAADKAAVKSLEAQQERQTKEERADLLATMEKERREHAEIRRDLEQKLRAASVPKAPTRDDSSARLAAADQYNRALDQKLKQLEQSVQQLQARATEQDQKIGKLSNERDELTKEVKAVSSERDGLAKTVAVLSSERAKLADGILKVEREREGQATTAAQAEHDRNELAAKLLEVQRQRDELAAKLAREAATTATTDAASENDGADSPSSSPTGIVIPRLAFGGNLPPVSSPKTGPPSLGILGQNQRPPIRGGANKKHRRR